MGHLPLISTRQFSLPIHVSLFPQKNSRILQGGFKIGGIGGHPISNGTSLGYGIYLGAAAATSLGYAAGGNRIFACRGTFRYPFHLVRSQQGLVIPGRTTNSPIQQPPPSVYVGSEDYECYNGGGVFVHRYASLVLPCYVSFFSQIEGYLA